MVDRKKAFRSDHKLVIKVKDIERQIREVCKEWSKELDIEICWSEATQLASGMSLREIVDYPSGGD